MKGEAYNLGKFQYIDDDRIAQFARTLLWLVLKDMISISDILVRNAADSYAPYNTCPCQQGSCCGSCCTDPSQIDST